MKLCKFYSFNYSKYSSLHYTFLAQFSYAIFQFFLVFFILKKGGVEELGFYGLFISILNPLQQFFKFGIPKLINTSEDLIIQKKYFVISSQSVFIFLLIGVFPILFFDTGLYFNLFVSLLFFKSLFNLRESQYAIYTRNKLFKSFFLSSVFCNTFLLVSFWLSYNYYKSIALSFTFSCLVLLGFIVIDNFKINSILPIRIKSYFNFNNFKSYLRILTEISISNFIFNFKSNLPRYIIAANFSIAMLGVYTAIFQAVSVLEILNQSILKFNYSKLTLSFHNKLKSFYKVKNKIYLSISLIVFVSLVVNYFFGEFLLIYFFGEEFKIFPKLLLILIFDRYFAMLNSIPKTVFILKDKIKFNIASTTIVLLVSYCILINIKDFIFFNVMLVLLSGLQFFLNKIIIRKII